MAYRVMSGIFPVLVTLLFAVILGPIALVGWWALDTAPPVRNIRGVALTPVVAPGERLVVEWKATFARICPGVSRRRFMDGFFVDLPDHRLRGIPPGAEIGTEATWRTSMIVPANMPPGQWTFESRPEFSCNPVQRLAPIVVEAPFVPFTVVSAPKS